MRSLQVHSEMAHTERVSGSTTSATGGRRIVRRVFCDRPKQAHTLARLIAEGDSLTVEFEAMVATNQGMAPRKGRLTPEDVEGYAAYGVMVTCPCGRNFDIDLVRLFAHEPVVPIPIEPGKETGVPYRRRRAKDV